MRALYEAIIGWPIFVIIFLVVVGALWAAWHYLPIIKLRRHRFENVKERLDSEDIHRRTLTPFLSSIAFMLPIGFGAYQYLDTTKSNLREADRRFSKEVAEQYAAAMNKIATPGEDSDLKIQAIFELERAAILGKEPPEHFILPLARILVPLIQDRARSPHNPVSRDCENSTDTSAVSEKDLETGKRIALERRVAEAALGTLGRVRNFTEFPIRLRKLYLDRMEIGGRTSTDPIKETFLGADFTGSYFRRSILTHATFDGVIFRNAMFAVQEMPDFDKSPVAARIMEGKDAYERDIHHCWIADLRDSSFVDADFTGAKLGGVDFRRANLKNAKFDGANISLANFCDTKEITPAQITSAAPWNDAPPRGKFPDLNMAPCGTSEKAKRQSNDGA